MQARYYDPVIGRFYSNDPVDSVSHLGNEEGIRGFNRYSYAVNNPYKYVDPDGLESIAAQQFNIEVRGLGSGRITRAQHSANVSARATGSRHIAKLNPIGRTVLAVLSVVEGTFNESPESSSENIVQGQAEVGDCLDCGGDTSNKPGKIGNATRIGFLGKLQGIIIRREILKLANALWCKVEAIAPNINFYK